MVVMSGKTAGRGAGATKTKIQGTLQDHLAFVSSVHVAIAHMGGRMSPQLEMLKGTLDLMVLQTLQAMGALHGYGIARRIEQVSRDAILLNQGTIYASLVRLQQRGLIKSEWGISENNRKAKFYSITARGSKRLAETAENWEQLSAVIARFFAAAKESQ
jgi:PadR family transcriptional regulator PadR